MTEITKLTLKQQVEGLNNKEFSALELNQEHINNAQKQENLNIYVTSTFDQALEKAKIADENYAKNNARELEGIPVGVKEVFCTKDVQTTACSKILKGFTPTYESTVTSNLFNSGAIMHGKISMDEFAMGSTNENSAFGPVLNPYRGNDNSDYVPGGSSGGSAASVTANFVAAALGTDTGGSIRQPAAFCGNVGVKPTYGRCSRWGMIAFASSLDQAGVFAKTVEDSALVLKNIIGHDKKDSTSANNNLPDFSSLKSGVKGMKIGIPKEYLSDNLDQEISQLWQKGAKWLEEQGAEIIDISLPHTKYALPTYYIIAPAEASSNLARYDGVRYGNRVETEACSLDEMYELTRDQGFGDEVKRRIMIGTYVLSAGYYDAYYKKAQRVRAKITQDFKNAFSNVDAILTPTTPTPAFKLGTKLDPIQMYLNDVFTVPASLAGLPGINVPAGISNGLPIGLQIIANSFEEEKMYRVAAAIENAANFKRLGE